MARGRGSFFPVQTVDFGAKGSPETFNQTTIPHQGKLGQLIEWNEKLFRLVLVDTSLGDVDTLDGGVVHWGDKSVWTVTADESANESGANGLAGGVHVVVDAGLLVDAYIYIQLGGYQNAVVVDDGNTNVGDHLTGGADNTLTFTNTGTGPPNKEVAIAVTADGSRTSANGATVAQSCKVRWLVGSLL